MKKLILFTAILFAQSVFADDPILGHFKCGSDQTGVVALDIQFDGPRYGDQIIMNYLGEDIKKFLMDEEQGLTTYEESFSTFLDLGICKKGTDDKVLVSCVLPEKQFNMSDYVFTHMKKMNDNGWTETIKESRPMSINVLNLQVIKDRRWDQQLNKEVNVAKLVLDMNANLVHKDNVDIHIEKELGMLDQNWYMCKFTAE